MYQSSKQSSPYQNRSEFNESPEEELHQSLDKYLSLGPHQNYSDKLKRQIILAQIESVNSELSTICKERFGDLVGTGSDLQWTQIQKTIKLVKTLTSLIHRESQNKKQLAVKLRRGDEQIARQSGMNDKLTKQKRTLEKEKQSLELKIKSMERQFKEDMEKIKRDKEEAEKKFAQIYNKENQYKNEMRKNQQIIAELQQKIKNKTGAKVDQSLIKNRFQVIEEVKSYGPSLVLANSENEFNKFFINNLENKQKAICQENQYLKDCLKNVYRQLHELLEVKRDIIRKRKGFESALDSEAFELQLIKPETFNLPREFSEQSLQRLNENLQKFKEALKINDMVQNKVQDQKVNCVNNVKNLLNNYKDIVQSQDKLINRVVLKSKEFKANEIANIDQKYSRLEEDELEKSKRFLEEQRQILLNRNKELELTRKAMKNTIKKAEEEKKLFNKKKTQTAEQLQLLKKNIQKLPAIVEQEISAMI